MYEAYCVLAHDRAPCIGEMTSVLRGAGKAAVACTIAAVIDDAALRARHLARAADAEARPEAQECLAAHRVVGAAP